MRIPLPSRLKNTWKIATGGTIVGAVGGTMLGIQTGATLALSRLWRSIRRQR